MSSPARRPVVPGPVPPPQPNLELIQLRRMVTLLAGLLYGLMFGALVILGAWLIVRELRQPTHTIRYVDKERITAQGWPGEWKIYLEVDGQPVAASVWSGEEYERLVEALRGER